MNLTLTAQGTGVRASTLPASPPGTKERLSARVKVSPIDAEADIQQPGPDRPCSARSRHSGSLKLGHKRDVSGSNVDVHLR